MIRIRSKTNVRPIENIARFYANWTDVVQDEGAATLRQIEQPFRDQLRNTPARRYWTREDWVSERQRRAVMAKLRAQGGPPYRRTGQYAAGWQIIGRANNEDFVLEVSNRTKYAQWVGGSLAQSPTAAARFQQPGHKRTGWPISSNTTRFWLNTFEVVLKQNITARFSAVVRGTTSSRRAFTRRRR